MSLKPVLPGGFVNVPVAAPGGSSGQAQYNNAGVFAGFTGLTIAAGALTGISLVGTVAATTFAANGGGDALTMPNVGQGGLRISAFGGEAFFNDAGGNIIVKGNGSVTRLGGGNISFEAVALTTEVVVQAKTFPMTIGGVACKVLCA